MVKDDGLYLTIILESIEKTENYLGKKSLAFLFSSTLHVDAISKQLEEIGESVKKISDKLKSDYPNVRWQAFLEARNFLSHAYQRASVHRIWEICKKDLPILKKQISKIIVEMDN